MVAAVSLPRAQIGGLPLHIARFESLALSPPSNHQGGVPRTTSGSRTSRLLTRPLVTSLKQTLSPQFAGGSLVDQTQNRLEESR